MKLIFVIAAIFIIGTHAKPPNCVPLPPTSPLTCDDIETLVNQLSDNAREALKNKILKPKSLLNLGGILGDLVVNLVDDLLSNLKILNLDKILLKDILSPIIAMPKKDFNAKTDPTWNCLVDLFESEEDNFY